MRPLHLWLMVGALAIPGCSCLGIHDLKNIKRSGAFECEHRTRVTEGTVTRYYDSGTTLRYRGDDYGGDDFNKHLALCDVSPNASIEAVMTLRTFQTGDLDVFGVDPSGKLRTHRVTDYDGVRTFQEWDATGRYVITSGFHWDKPDSRRTVGHIWDVVSWSEPTEVRMPDRGSLVSNSPDAELLLFMEPTQADATRFTLFTWRPSDGDRHDFTYPRSESGWMLETLAPSRAHFAQRITWTKTAAGWTFAFHAPAAP